MSKAEHHTLFATVEPICSLNACLYQKVSLLAGLGKSGTHLFQPNKCET